MVFFDRDDVGLKEKARRREEHEEKDGTGRVEEEKRRKS
jgi:hypothetical protein